MSGWLWQAFRGWDGDVVLCVVLVLQLAGCGGGSERPEESAEVAQPAAPEQVSPEQPRVQREPWGTTSDGRTVEQFLLSNASGATVTLISLGAAVTGVHVPDARGEVENVVLHLDDVAAYEVNSPYFGVICGRYANRIALGRFTLDGQPWQLAINNKPNHLHGGKSGFGRQVWHASVLDVADSASVRFTYISPDGDDGYPGQMTVMVTYTLDDRSALTIDYTATTDRKTVLNLTSHCYWNLAGVPAATGPAAGDAGGEQAGTILGHQLQLFCDRYLPVDSTLIPTGELADVAETSLDFRQPRPVGQKLPEAAGGPPGFDHCFVVNHSEDDPAPVARVVDPASGRVMEVFSTEPGVQFYTGNFLDGSAASGGYARHSGLCLECQHFPDSPNQPQFPTTVLSPQEVYTQKTVYRFSVVKPAAASADEAGGEEDGAGDADEPGSD